MDVEYKRSNKIVYMVSQILAIVLAQDDDHRKRCWIKDKLDFDVSGGREDF